MVYAAMVDRLDQNVGKLIDYLNPSMNMRTVFFSF